MAFTPTGYISWDLAYRSALLRCAELTIQNGYRYFGVVAIENYSSASSFALPENSHAHVFTDVNADHSTKIEYFDVAGNLLLSRNVLPGPTHFGGLSFLGVGFAHDLIDSRLGETEGDLFLVAVAPPVIGVWEQRNREWR